MAKNRMWSSAGLVGLVYGYGGSLTELTQVPGTGMNVLAELTEVVGIVTLKRTKLREGLMF